MIKLTPSIYKTNTQQILSARNIVDTVKMHPIDNSVGDNAVFHTTTLKEVELNGTTTVLPISNNVAPTHWRMLENEWWNGIIYGDDWFAKSRVDCVMVSGKTTCVADTVALGEPTVSVKLLGTSAVISRGGSSYSDYPGVDDLKNPNWSLANWIESNKVETKSTLTHDYSKNTFSLNPWVRKIVQQPSTPTANDVITDWVKRYDGTYLPSMAQHDAWTEYSNFDSAEFASFDMFSPNGLTYPKDEITQRHGSRLVMKNKFLKMALDVERKDDYTYEISWTLPVRFAYAAASRARVVNFSDADDYAYVDNVTDIVFEISSQPLNTKVIDITYGLDIYGDLTPDASGQHIVDIDAGEAFTLGTRSLNFFEGTSDLVQWTEMLPTLLLNKYKDGKYVFTCDVSAVWAIKNSITINTQVQVQLPDGTLLERNGETCTFSIKNITKKYEQRNFIYSLSLLED